MDTTAISTSAISNLSNQVKHADEPKSNELGQDVFLELMITQMRNQNPLDPQTNSEFVAQLAQFSSVEGLDKLNTTTENMSSLFQSSQALQASSMVGREVKVATETAILENGNTVRGTIELPASSGNVEMNIYNSGGELVAHELLGERAAGDIAFAWNGLAADGARLPADTYRFEALASVGRGETMQLGTSLSANIDSVSVGGNGVLTLNVAGVGPVSMSNVKEIL
jgi:flagellar basal-body rod modification protein FlgD